MTHDYDPTLLNLAARNLDDLSRQIDPDTLLTVRDAAALLAVSYTMMVKWRYANVGPPYIKLPRTSGDGFTTYRYRHGDIVAFIRHLKHLTAGPPMRFLNGMALARKRKRKPPVHHTVTTNPTRRDKQPSTVDMVVWILRNGPVHSSAVLDQLFENGWETSSDKPSKYVNQMLWRNKNWIMHANRHGYWKLTPDTMQRLAALGPDITPADVMRSNWESGTRTPEQRRGT